MSSITIASITMVAITASTIGLLAFVCAKRQAAAIFLVSVVALWCGVSSALGYHSSATSLIPDRIPLWRHVLATFIGFAPLAVLPAAFTIAPVLGRVALRHIPLLATGGAVVALPMLFMTALASSCYIAFDCP